MKIIKLHTIHSTNDYLKSLTNDKLLEDFTVVWADFQSEGKGQRGSSWLSKKGKNLTFSVFLDTSFLLIEQQFYLNIITSLAVYNLLKKKMIEHVKIKWPNDILSDNKKICGILIENSFKSQAINHSVIGVGLNVNQTDFAQLHAVTSLKDISGIHYHLEEILTLFVTELKQLFTELKKGNFETLFEQYTNDLFRKNKPSTFKDAKGNLFSGFIKNVSEMGKLQVLVENDFLQEFDLKEIKLLY